MPEFNLSEKAEEIAKHYQKITDRDAGVQLGISLIMQLNKEFIKILLGTYDGMDENWIQKSTIKKLAGEKLNG